MKKEEKKRCIKYDELGKCIKWEISEKGYLEGTLLKGCPIADIRDAIEKGKVKLRIPIEPKEEEGKEE